MVSQVDFTKNSKKYNTNLLKLFQNILEERQPPSSSYEASIILIPKPDKDATQKEKYRSISLMITDAKILNKILANQIQQYIKKIINHDQVGFILGMQVWYNNHVFINVIHYINIMKDRNRMIISIDAEKEFSKIQHPFMIRTLSKVELEGRYLNEIKAIYDRDISFHHSYSTQYWKSVIREEVIKGIQIKKEDENLPIFADDTILYIENPKDLNRKLLELIQ